MAGTEVINEQYRMAKAGRLIKLEGGSIQERTFRSINENIGFDLEKEKKFMRSVGKLDTCTLRNNMLTLFFLNSQSYGSFDKLESLIKEEGKIQFIEQATILAITKDEQEKLIEGQQLLKDIADLQKDIDDKISTMQSNVSKIYQLDKLVNESDELARKYAPVDVYHEPFTEYVGVDLKGCYSNGEAVYDHYESVEHDGWTEHVSDGDPTLFRKYSREKDEYIKKRDDEWYAIYCSVRQEFGQRLDDIQARMTAFLSKLTPPEAILYQVKNNKKNTKLEYLTTFADEAFISRLRDKVNDYIKAKAREYDKGSKSCFCRNVRYSLFDKQTFITLKLTQLAERVLPGTQIDAANPLEFIRVTNTREYINSVLGLETSKQILTPIMPERSSSSQKKTPEILN